jgi:hypothetical protein
LAYRKVSAVNRQKNGKIAARVSESAVIPIPIGPDPLIGMAIGMWTPFGQGLNRNSFSSVHSDIPIIPI